MIRNVIVKVTHECNIRCKYCYVRRNREFRTGPSVMGEETLEKLIVNASKYLKPNSDMERFVFYWHGGEPLLAEPSFFRRCQELQDRHIPKQIHVVNTLQTNGILLDKTWLELLRDIGYGLCISLDGPPEIHDLWRKSIDGRGTYAQVMRGISLLKEYGFSLSVLAVVTPQSLGRGRRIYRHFREIGFNWIDFMYPFYSRIDNTLDQSIAPRLWGDFFNEVFDAWMDEGDPDVYIRMLHDMCMLQMGAKTSMCASSVDCSYVITIDPSGNVYVCDDLLAYADSYLGNIHADSFFDIDKNSKLTRLALKDVLIGDDCKKCDYFEFCKGGCTLFRARRRDDFSGKHYFCEAQRAIISHIQSYFLSLMSEQSVAP